MKLFEWLWTGLSCYIWSAEFSNTQAKGPHDQIHDWVHDSPGQPNHEANIDSSSTFWLQCITTYHFLSGHMCSIQWLQTALHKCCNIDITEEVIVNGSTAVHCLRWGCEMVWMSFIPNFSNKSLFFLLVSLNLSRVWILYSRRVGYDPMSMPGQASVPDGNNFSPHLMW